MRQLTGLDAQFLALENALQAGHVGGLGILDPSTRPSGRLELGDVMALISERLPLLPSFRWRLKQVPFGLDYPYWVDDPDFDLESRVSRARDRAGPAADRRQARRAGWPDLLAAAGPRAPPVGGVRHPGAAG